MTEPMAKVTHYTDIPADAFGDEAPGVTIRLLIDEENDGAPVYVLRMIEIAPGGHTPHHGHPFEHENFVLEGSGTVLIDDDEREVGPGDVVFVPPGVRHQYRNAGGDTLRFLCGIPAKHLQC